jgi:hypothetical protein
VDHRAARLDFTERPRGVIGTPKLDGPGLR